jgi:CDP-diacylglycerol--glycerol-3-phosphate 3-phosphatidyltransferase
MPAESLLTTPNVLSLSRIPLAVALAFAIDARCWQLSLALFTLAAFTDWLDGWWARRFNQLSAMGRSLDPLTDKVLIGTAFIVLQSAAVGVTAGMTAIIIGREILVTGLRGIVETAGAKFGADWSGKLKTFLQSVVLFAIFIHEATQREMSLLQNAITPLLWATVGVTLASGVMYLLKAIRLLSKT